MENILQTPTYESKRLAELNEYGILDTTREIEYEEVALHASVICQTPVALITFIDENRQWVKASIGCEPPHAERIHSFCHHAIQNPKEIMVVEDARTDERFKDNPFVTNEPNVVFYAGIPLFNRQGFGLGTVCVLDVKPRTLNENQKRALRILSIQVMHLLELRRIQHEAEMIKSLPDDIHNHSFEKLAGLFADQTDQPLDSLIESNELLKNLYKTEKDGEQDNPATGLQEGL